jgi:Zn-dependent peptidase ImmA (M78 family)
MQIAMTKAEEARRTLGGTLAEALERLGLRVIVRPLSGRVREAYFGDFIVLSKGLSDAERRELAAHALGHHLLHAGNHWHAGTRTYTRANYQERQADVFAAFFLMPEADLADSLAIDESVPRLAEQFAVPEPFVRFRLRLHAARLRAVS